ncbi:MAG TPA: urease accessory protein UreD [Chthoniobacteraceae bacterium]|nr:urease accessory protein UreD [Chthoniobacteraceae bacterium]
MKGGLQLVCGLDSAGRSALKRQYVSAPMHLSKPWWEEGVLIVNAINSTAGLFAGDVIDTAIEVTRGAQMLLTSASANRAHRMPAGRAAVHQTLRVETGAWLEVWPSLFIPHAGSNYFQDTSVEIDEGARFLWFETVAPGRVASGEAWEFTRYESRFRLTCEDRLIARETYSLTPASPSVQALRQVFSTACHATCYAAGADFPAELLAAVSALHHTDCWVGCTRLDAPAIAIRMVAANNLHLARAMNKVRDLLHAALGRHVPALRRA